MTDLLKCQSYKPGRRAAWRFPQISVRLPRVTARRWRDGVTEAAIGVARVAGTVFGAGLIPIGLVLAPLPIPLGLPTVALGVFILYHSCPPARGLMRRWLAAHPGVVRRARGAAGGLRARFTRRGRV